MASLFEKLNQGKPPPAEQAQQPEVIRMGPAATTIPTTSPNAHPTEKVLDWLLNYWPKPTISLREICRLGPHAFRDWESAMDLAETLVQRGWFIRCNAQKRRDMRVWQIVRGSKATLSPTSPIRPLILTPAQRVSQI